MKKVIGIYKIENGKGDVYIGSSLDIKKRFSNHLAKLRKDCHEYKELQESYNVDTNNVKFEILEECNELELEDLENFYIEYCNKIDGWNVINKQIIATRKSRVNNKERMCNSQKGMGNGNSRLSISQVIEIKGLLEENNKTQKKIADMFNVSQTQIWRIKHEERWGHVKVG